MSHEALQDMAWTVERMGAILRELGSGEYNAAGQMRRLGQLERLAARLTAIAQEVHIE